MVWNSIRRNANPPTWLAAIYHPIAIRNCSLYLWLALRGRLMTKDRMRNFGLNVNLRCTLCYSYDESASHLFVSCPYTAILLRGSPVPLSLDWNDWLNGIFCQGTQPAWLISLVYLYISVVTYSVWRERNDRIHSNGRPKSVTTLLMLIKCMVRERVHSSQVFRKRIAKDPIISALLY